MPRQVRIVGDPETYEVLCETESTKVLINPAARMRLDLAHLEEQMAELRRQLDHHACRRVTDVSGNEMTGP